jgi:mono/diheme cytochrome c family protein
MVRSIYTRGIRPVSAGSGEVAQPHLLLDPFKLSRIAFFGFSALPNCAFADDEVARGKYIVENVAKCSECHSPRGQDDELGKGLSLSGAQLEFKPITPNDSWAESAPNIRGIRGYNQEAAVTLFSRGIAKNYGQLAPPMPSYKMTQDDADAVYKYLKSLQP